MKIITIEDNEITKSNQEIINVDGLWVAVDDMINLLEKEGIEDDSFRYVQGWEIARYLRDKAFKGKK